MTLVYFIQAETGGPVKIGIAKNVAQRLRSLQTSHPAKLRALATMPGGRRLERELHERLATHRLSGEWFADCDDVQREIAIAASAPVKHAPAEWEAPPVDTDYDAMHARCMDIIAASLIEAARSDSSAAIARRLGNITGEGVRKIASGKCRKMRLDTLMAFAAEFACVSRAMSHALEIIEIFNERRGVEPALPTHAPYFDEPTFWDLDTQRDFHRDLSRAGQRA